jgi:hypothetical protein
MNGIKIINHRSDKMKVYYCEGMDNGLVMYEREFWFCPECLEKVKMKQDTPNESIYSRPFDIYPDTYDIKENDEIDEYECDQCGTLVMVEGLLE